MKVHFIAIGGSVMHQLAIALKRKGYIVSGSDDEIFEPAKSNLQNEGLLPAKEGWFPERITGDIDAVILGMHAKDDNPELQQAKRMGAKIYSFPEYIYEESKDKTRIIVGGSHGKTTTTAMIMHVLKTVGKEFDYLVGAKLEGFDQSVNITHAPLIVCEGDEYPASALEKRPKFHFLFPNIAIITGIAWDHINVFPTFEFYLEQFKIFIDKIQPGGVLIYNETDEVLRKLVLEHGANINVIAYGLPQHEVTANGETIIHIENTTSPIKVFGNHNLLNMQAAYLACKQCGITAQQFVSAIANFTGAARRLEVLDKNETTTVFRDFAHAPSKVTATIEAVKQQFPQRKLIAVLELHTYSSLSEKFMAEYRGAMEKADIAIVFYSGHALELKRMPMLSKDAVMQGFDKKGMLVITDKDELYAELTKFDYKNTNLLLMSSGNYDGLDLTQLMKTIQSL